MLAWRGGCSLGLGVWVGESQALPPSACGASPTAQLLCALPPSCGPGHSCSPGRCDPLILGSMPSTRDTGPSSVVPSSHSTWTRSVSLSLLYPLWAKVRPLEFIYWSPNSSTLECDFPWKLVFLLFFFFYFSICIYLDGTSTDFLHISHMVWWSLGCQCISHLNSEHCPK